MSAVLLRERRRKEMEKHDGGKEAKTEERRNAGPEGGCSSKAQTTNL